MAALPGLGFVQALELTQASTAVSIVVPGGPAAGMATSFTMLQRSGFRRSAITRALTLTALWNQFLNFLYPVLAVFLLTISGEGDRTALLATAAFVGVAALGVGITGFVLALTSGRLAHDVGNLAARLATWALKKIRRGPGDVGRRELRAVPQQRGRARAEALACPDPRVARRQPQRVRRPARVAAGARRAVLRGDRVRSVRRVGARPPRRAASRSRPGGIGVVELALTSTLVAFGGNNAGVVAAVLVYRFLTMIPTLAFGLVVAGTWRRHLRAADAAAPTV